jgi:hypothetical protein
MEYSLDLKFACGHNIKFKDAMISKLTETQVLELQNYARQNANDDIKNEIVSPLKLESKEFQRKEVIENKNELFEEPDLDIQVVPHALDRYSQRVDGFPYEYHRYSHVDEIEKINELIEFVRNSEDIEEKIEFKGESVFRYNFKGEINGEYYVVATKFPFNYEGDAVVLTIIDKARI